MNKEKNDVYDFVLDPHSNREEEVIHIVTMHKIKEILKDIDPDNIIYYFDYVHRRYHHYGALEKEIFFLRRQFAILLFHHL